MPKQSVRAPHSLWKSLCFKGFLRHTTPHFMAYFGVIFFANMGGGGGQNYFQPFLEACCCMTPLVWTVQRTGHTKKQLRVVNLVRVVNLLPHCDLLSRPPSADTIFLGFTGGFRLKDWFQEPKKNPKAKKPHEQRQRIFWTIRGAYRSLPIKTRVLRQIAPESSPESSAKSLSQKFFGVPFLSLMVHSIVNMGRVVKSLRRSNSLSSPSP